MHIIRFSRVAAKKSWASMAPIEGFGWAVEHCSHYLKGSDKVVTMITDHSPLVAVFEKCPYYLSQRLWNVRSRMMDYRIQVSWVPGKQLR